MIIDDKIVDEKLQYNINKEVAKISALQSGKMDKYENLKIHIRIRIIRFKIKYKNSSYR